MKQRFEHELFEPKLIKQINGEKKRYYETEDGSKYPSVTTALGYFSRKGIARWRAMVGNEEANKVGGRAARFGNIIHDMAEKYVLNEEDWSKDRSIIAIERFSFIQKYLDEYLTKVYASELPLYSHDLETAGTSDLICEYRGKPTCLDFKTSKKNKEKEDIIPYFIQCSAYSIMMRELYDFEVEQLVILMSTEQGIGIEFIEPLSNWEKMTRKFFDLYGRGLL